MILKQTSYKKLAYVLGASGMDGEYMVELLLQKGLSVVGYYRYPTEVITKNETRHFLRLYDASNRAHAECLAADIARERPHMIFNCIGDNMLQDDTMVMANLSPVETVLNAIRDESSETRFINFSSCHIFGSNIEADGRQKETTKIDLRSRYATSKFLGHQLCDLYREQYGLFVASAILFNHSSFRRRDKFFETKVTSWIEKNYKNLHRGPVLELGDIDLVRDFSHAWDCVRAAFSMATINEPENYCVGSGVGTKLRDIVKLIFEYYMVDYEKHVVISDSLTKPGQPQSIIADNTKLIENLSWKPTMALDHIIKELVLKRDLRYEV